MLLKLWRGQKAMFAMMLLFICILAGASGQICWKHAMNNREEIRDINSLFNAKTVFGIFTDKYIISGLIFYGFALIFWLGAMSTLDISLMYPMLSLAYVIVAVMAYLFLGENIALVRWVGITLILVGSVLITRG